MQKNELIKTQNSLEELCKKFISQHIPTSEIEKAPPVEEGGVKQRTKGGCRIEQEDHIPIEIGSNYMPLQPLFYEICNLW